MQITRQDAEFLGGVLERVQLCSSDMISVEPYDDDPEPYTTCPGCGARMSGIHDFFDYAGSPKHGEDCQFLRLLLQLNDSAYKRYLEEKERAEKVLQEQEERRKKRAEEEAQRKAEQEALRQEMATARADFLRAHNLTEEDLLNIIRYRAQETGRTVEELGGKVWDEWEWEVAVGKWREAGEPEVEVSGEGAMVGRVSWP